MNRRSILKAFAFLPALSLTKLFGKEKKALVTQQNFNIFDFDAEAAVQAATFTQPKFQLADHWQRFHWQEGPYVWSLYAKAIPDVAPTNYVPGCSGFYAGAVPKYYNFAYRSIQMEYQARMQGVDCPDCEDGVEHVHLKPRSEGLSHLANALHYAQQTKPVIFTTPDGEDFEFSTAEYLVAELHGVPYAQRLPRQHCVSSDANKPGYLLRYSKKVG